MPVRSRVRAAKVSSPLVWDANGGDVAVQVVSAEAFNPGVEVSIFDTTQRGWYASHAVIRGIDDNILYLDQPINMNRLCLRERGGTVAHAFPAFVAWEVHDCGLQSLSIDGGEGMNQSVFADFTISAIHFVRTTDARIRDCVILRWSVDGVSVQGGSGTIVTNCLSQECLGHGFHPGTSVKYSLWTNNIGRENGRDGLYFCMYVRHSVVSNSTFHGDGRYGIGGLGGGGDQYNLVVNNTCVDNACHGIEASCGKNNTISSNICLNNSQEEVGKYSGIGLHDVTGMLVNANRCLDDQEISTQGYGIEEQGESNQNLIVANHCQGNRYSGIMTVGDHTKCTENLE